MAEHRDAHTMFERLMGSCPLLVIVERDIALALRDMLSGRDTRCFVVTALHRHDRRRTSSAPASRIPCPGSPSHAGPQGAYRALSLVGHSLCCHGLRRCWFPRANGVGWPLARRPQKAATQEIEVGAAKHLALEQFEAIDVAFDGAVTPGHGHPSFDSGIVVAQPLRKTLQGRPHTGRGASQPAIEALRLAGPHELRKVPGQRDRFSELRLLRGQQGQLLFLVRSPGLRPPEHEPGGSSRREVAVLGFRDDGNGCTAGGGWRGASPCACRRRWA